MLNDEQRRARLADVVAAVEDGRVEGEDAAALGELLELGLSTGRLRSVYGPEGEQAALGLFRRLPQGRELSQTTSDLNEALVPFTIFFRSGKERVDQASLDMAKAFGIRYLVSSETPGSAFSAAARAGIPASGGHGP